MTIKTELIALGVRLLADKTTLIRKPTGFESFVDELVYGESYDARIARNLEGELDRAVAATKQMTSRRRFRKTRQIKVINL